MLKGVILMSLPTSWATTSGVSVYLTWARDLVNPCYVVMSGPGSLYGIYHANAPNATSG